MKTRSVAYLMMALVLVGGDAVCASASGTTGGSILNMPVGARAIAMGEAYTALADDVSSLYWNPAGIALLNQSQASFMYSQLLEDLSYQHAAVGVPLEYGGVGASVSYLSYGDIQGFDAAGNENGNVSAYSGVANLGGAFIANAFSAGFNVKGVQTSLDGAKATGFAADLGSTFVFPREVMGGTLRAAATVRNLGPGIKFLDQTDPLPRAWRVGLAAVQMRGKRLNFGFDFGQERDAKASAYIGGEYLPVKFLALRAGYAGTEAEGDGVRLGIGFKIRDILFDYAYSNFGDLGMAHRYELSVRFGAPRSRLTPEERKILRQAKLAMAEKRYGEATQLFDALIQLAPDYQPARQLIRMAMAGYEGQEAAENRSFASTLTLTPTQKKSMDYPDDSKDLENLLNISDESMARSRATEPQGRNQEAKP